MQRKNYIMYELPIYERKQVKISDMNRNRKILIFVIQAFFILRKKECFL